MAYVNYKGYCYPDSYSAFNAMKSEAIFQIDGHSYTEFFLDSAAQNYYGSNTSFQIEMTEMETGLTQVVHIELPQCDIIGPMVTTTMMTPADAVTLSWAVVAVFVTAYMLKLLRRTL